MFLVSSERGTPVEPAWPKPQTVIQVIARCGKLTYLDDRPVFEDERRCTQALSPPLKIIGNPKPEILISVSNESSLESQNRNREFGFQ